MSLLCVFRHNYMWDKPYEREYVYNNKYWSRNGERVELIKTFQDGTCERCGWAKNRLISRRDKAAPKLGK